jgi:hypothetical protein
VSWYGWDEIVKGRYSYLWEGKLSAAGCRLQAVRRSAKCGDAEVAGGGEPRDVGGN